MANIHFICLLKKKPLNSNELRANVFWKRKLETLMIYQHLSSETIRTFPNWLKTSRIHMYNRLLSKYLLLINMTSSQSRKPNSPLICKYFHLWEQILLYGHRLHSHYVAFLPHIERRQSQLNTSYHTYRLRPPYKLTDIYVPFCFICCIIDYYTLSPINSYHGSSSKFRRHSECRNNSEVHVRL